ncbi:MAG: hypothetical protein IPP29_15685 [Bacteroidetes bacterium]|nr:hypothetical protein [Bacteroidota bacterium]
MNRLIKLLTISLIVVLCIGIFSPMNAQNQNKKDSAKVKNKQQTSATSKAKDSNATSKSKAGGNSNSISNDCQQKYVAQLVLFQKGQYDKIPNILAGCRQDCVAKKKANLPLPVDRGLLNKIFKISFESYKNIDNMDAANKCISDLMLITGESKESVMNTINASSY